MAADPSGAESPAGATARHRLAGRDFEALATGGGDVQTVSQLLVAERSWRLLTLRALLDALLARPAVTGPLPPVGQAWELLARAQRSAQSEVDRLLLHPHVGTWAGYTLRRLRGSADHEAPLWVDVGYLHAIAATASIRAGLDFTIAIPVRDGFAALPALGAARLPTGSSWGCALVRASAGVVTISANGRTVGFPPGGGAADGWLPIPTIRTAAGSGLSVQLDYVDPYRNLRSPTSPEPLTAAQLRRWQVLLTQAWQLLTQVRPELAPPLALGLQSVVPQPPAERFRTMSASAGDAFGCTLVSEPADGTELAVTLVHEFQHIKLGGLLHLAALYDGEPVEPLYAPWRDDPRPLAGVLQGVYAFVGITEFWRALRRITGGTTERLAEFEFARWRSPVVATLQRLARLPQLTDLGRQLVDGLLGTAADWDAEQVPAEVLTAAQLAVADHRTRWRLHHLRPDPALVGSLATAWLAGGDPPAGRYPEPAVVRDPAGSRLDTRAVLMLWRLTDPGGFAQLRRDPATVGERVAGATPTDLAYVAGERAAARPGYLAEITAGPQRVSAWAGLALLGAAGDLADASVPVHTTGDARRATALLRQRPELVFAVYQRIRVASDAPPDPMELAGWLAGSAAGLSTAEPA
jgi:HEXXH motif-containing protein